MSTILAIPRMDPPYTAPFPDNLELIPRRRWPTTLPDETVQTVLAAPVACFPLPGREYHRAESGYRVSIVIPTLDNLVCNRLCLESLLANTEYGDYEVLVVDNGSADGTLAYLAALCRNYPHVRVLAGPRNLGFAPAVNWGLSSAVGQFLVVLNNDTVLPPGWLRPLLERLADPRVGMVGPLTNRTGNEAQIEVPYRTYGEMLRFAQDLTAQHQGQQFSIRMLAMFCAALRRDVFQQIGPLDERFEVGLFEDDDYAMRLRQAGLDLVCAEDAFVHHFGQASLGQLPTGAYGRLFHENRKRWEAKWGTTWQPYQRRANPVYEQLRLRIWQSVERLVPSEAAVLVISKGDDNLLQLGGRPAGHFPQSDEGGYAGYHPADCAEAITHLESLRAAGRGQFLLLPQTEFWWLDHYRDFRRYLEEHYAAFEGTDNSCLIYSLVQQAPHSRPPAG